MLISSPLVKSREEISITNFLLLNRHLGQGHNLGQPFGDIGIVIKTGKLGGGTSLGEKRYRNTGMGIGGPADTGLLIEDMGHGYRDRIVTAIEEGVLSGKVIVGLTHGLS